MDCSFTSKRVAWLGSHPLRYSSMTEAITFWPFSLIAIFTVTTVKSDSAIRPEVWDGWVTFIDT